MKQPHDTQVGLQVLERNLHDLTAVAANKGYDWEALRTRLRAESITPLALLKSSSSDIFSPETAGR